MKIVFYRKSILLIFFVTYSYSCWRCYEMKEMIKIIFSAIIVGFSCSILWILFGVIFYINTVASVPALAAVSGISGTKHAHYFLWGVPLIAAVIGMIFCKKKEIKFILVSFLVGTVLFTFMITGL